ncbi:MAG: YebC/PmpR family DNA-binding transcriptional regulator [Clostridia bacterium]|nr:YebC/PmpR family DNA-binding transcriptional regulator [Clostridia bacterium]
MSGHSKWKNIMHKKGKTDAQRAKVFTKMAKEIMVVVKEGGADPASNSRLADVIAKAKAANVPNDNIERAIKKGAGAEGGADYINLTYEGYGPGGVAVVVECLTDNKNRTAGNIRHWFDKFGGNLGATGSVAWQFKTYGQLIIEKADGIDEDELMMLALDSGADDFTAEEEAFEIICAPENFHALREALEGEGYTFLSAEVTRIPDNEVTLTDEKDIKFMGLLIENLEDDDDVQNIYHNAANEDL